MTQGDHLSHCSLSFRDYDHAQNIHILMWSRQNIENATDLQNKQPAYLQYLREYKWQTYWRIVVLSLSHGLGTKQTLYGQMQALKQLLVTFREKKKIKFGLSKHVSYISCLTVI